MMMAGLDEDRQFDENPDINDFWIKRWEEGRIGWHHQDFNAHLLSFWGYLGILAEDKIFVPLCGKSHDMAWLAKQGHEVVGIELSPLAVAEFFDEQQLTPERTSIGGLESWQAGPYQIYCGDIFRMQPQNIKGVTAVYDRASLVAFNPEQRRDYAALLERILPPDCKMLLVTMDYPQQEMQGPPYSVHMDEVQSLFGASFTIEQLDSVDLLTGSERYRERGLSRLHEEVYRLTRSTAG